MSGRFSWSPEGAVMVACHVYPSNPPILTVADGAGVVVGISDEGVVSVSAGHAEFAREFAEAARLYAEECARWVAGGEARPGDTAV